MNHPVASPPHPVASLPESVLHTRKRGPRMRVMGGQSSASAGAPARLLPWTGTGGRPCYLVGSGTGYVARRADEVEEIQLDMAYELLGHAEGLLAGTDATAPQLHFLASRLSESLEQVQRIAESRGSRLEAALAEARPHLNRDTSP